LKTIKTLVAATAACLFVTGCYGVRPAAQGDPYAEGGMHYYYLNYYLYYPDTGDGRGRGDGKLWNDFEGVVSDEKSAQNRMASRAYLDDGEIRAE
jgi:hypothetical protein